MYFEVNYTDSHVGEFWISKLIIPIVMLENFGSLTFEPRHEKTNVLVSDLDRHIPGCTATKNG